MPVSEKLGLEYEIWADRVLYFPAAVPDPVFSIDYMEKTGDWYENGAAASLYGGAARDDCMVDFPSQEEADVVTETFRTYGKLFGYNFTDPNFQGFRKEDIEYNGVRYRLGGEADSHIDQPVEHDIGLVNICLYLNDNYVGGDLGFDGIVEKEAFKPKAGDIILFPGHFSHYAKHVLEGTKYLVLIKMFMDGPGVQLPDDIVSDIMEQQM